MAYEMVVNGKTEFAIDWGIVERILRSYWTALEQYDNAREVRISESTWYNPLSWSLPDVAHVEVDWEQVRSRAAQRTENDLRAMRLKAKHDASGVAYELDWRVEQAAKVKEAFVDWMGDVQTQNTANITKAVADYDDNVAIAKFVRDASADGLMVGASVMSGGAAVAVMGGGSFMKAGAKFQDTGSYGAAAMEGTGSFAFAYVKLGKKFSFKQDVVLAMIQAPWKLGTELVAGKSFGEAALAGALKLPAPLISQAFKVGPLKTMFDRLAIPIVIEFAGKNVGGDFMGKLAAKMVQSVGVEKKLKSAVLGSKSSADLSLGSKSSADFSLGGAAKVGPLIGEATLTNKYLLYVGFVNMQQGIGRGW